MTDLLLNEFKGYDLESFVSFLQMDTDYRIFLPRYNALPDAPSNELAWEFAIAGYVGEVLNQMSESFFYAYSPAHERGWFMFSIMTESVLPLAELLLRASSAFGNEGMFDSGNFYNMVIDFINEGNNNFTCQDLFDIADYYFLKTGEE